MFVIVPGSESLGWVTNAAERELLELAAKVYRDLEDVAPEFTENREALVRE